MKNDSKIYKTYVEIMHRELVPAMGCTEPIAVAFCAAKARAELGSMPESVHIQASGNIIKNVKSVIVPHTNGLRGLESAAAVGILYGDADKRFEVISAVTHEQELALAEKMKAIDFKISPLNSDHLLDLIVTVCSGDNCVSVHIEDEHTNITEIIHNGKCVFVEKEQSGEEVSAPDHSLLTVADIFDFANTVKLSDVEAVLNRQIRYNSAISKEGLTNNYGARIGQLLMKRDDTIRTRAKAYAAAGSDARMSGCDMPVIINSGSGNQGIASSVPVIVYACEKGYGKESLYRALIFSALLTIYQKNFIGKLSAFCGAVSASCAAGAAITYISGGSARQIEDTVSNTLANIPGIICDGAKVSCAAKIASSIDASMMAHYLAIRGKVYADSGIIQDSVDRTISSVGHIGRVGMKETDKDIIREMLEKK